MSRQTVPIVVPDAGFEEMPVRVGQWLVDVGDRVGLGDRLVELICGGVLVPVVASDAGELEAVVCRSAQRVKVGQVLGSLLVSEAPSPESDSPSS